MIRDLDSPPFLGLLVSNLNLVGRGVVAGAGGTVCGED